MMLLKPPIMHICAAGKSRPSGSPLLTLSLAVHHVMFLQESIVYTQLCEQMCLCGGSHSVPPECQQVVMAATERSHRLHHHHHHPADIHRDGPASGVMPDTDGAASVEQLALPPFSDL